MREFSIIGNEDGVLIMTRNEFYIFNDCSFGSITILPAWPWFDGKIESRDEIKLTFSAKRGINRAHTMSEQNAISIKAAIADFFPVDEPKVERVVDL